MNALDVANSKSITIERRWRHAWNKGKIVGQKPPIKPKHVWAIRTQLQLQGKHRDLALFNFAIDSKLRGCDVVRVRMIDIAPEGCALSRAIVRQKKTGQPVQFEITDNTRSAIDDYLRVDPRPFTLGCSRGAAIWNRICPLGNTRGLCRNGWRSRGSIQCSTGRIHYDGRRHP